ncbi:MAG TPA: hypothetical protein DCQ34_02760 [Chitinophagaceae bacterium]|nr:hypothetical protein [Chitinophagaceae bacterium]
MIFILLEQMVFAGSLEQVLYQSVSFNTGNNRSKIVPEASRYNTQLVIFMHNHPIMVLAKAL